MVHRVIKETVIEYDQNGKIARRTITETREDGVCDCSSKE